MVVCLFNMIFSCLIQFILLVLGMEEKKVFNPWDIDFFWRKENTLPCAIRQISKINILQDGRYLNIHHITLMIVSTVLSSDSSAAILKTVECEIEYQSYRKSIATFYLHFESKTNLIVSNLTFELGPCKAAMKYCKKQTISNLYKKNNSSNGVKCAQEIDHFTEIKSASLLS